MLNNDIMQKIENILANGNDVEIRKNKYGITVASVRKRVEYKELPSERELAKEPK